MKKRKAKLELLSEYMERNARFYIELCLAAALFVYGLAIALPIDIATPIGTSVSYGWPRVVLGLCLATPSAFLISLRITGDMYEYIYRHQKRRRSALFLILISYIYLGVLSITLALPGFIFYFALAAISLIAYLRLGG